MKKRHIILLAATYRPFTPDSELQQSLPPVKAPKNYVDAVKIDHYIRENTELRNAALSEVWLLKNFESLHIRYFSDGISERAIDKPEMELEIIWSPEVRSKVGEFLQYLCDRIAEARENYEEVLFLGIGVRDILRILVRDFGESGLAPLAYQWISDQREVIDPMTLAATEKTKMFDPIDILRRTGIDLPDGYLPGRSCRTDNSVSSKFYNAFCRDPHRHSLPV